MEEVAHQLAWSIAGSVYDCLMPQQGEPADMKAEVQRLGGGKPQQSKTDFRKHKRTALYRHLTMALTNDPNQDATALVAGATTQLLTTRLNWQWVDVSSNPPGADHDITQTSENGRNLAEHVLDQVVMQADAIQQEVEENLQIAARYRRSRVR